MKVKMAITLCLLIALASSGYIYHDFAGNEKLKSVVPIRTELKDIMEGKSLVETGSSKEITRNEENSSIKVESEEVKAAPRPSINTRFSDDKELLIGGKTVLSLQYQEIVKRFGKPKEVKQVKVYFPATVEPYYSYILKYDSIDIEMYPEGKNTPVENTRSFRFDITGSKYDFYGIRIGMSLEDYLKEKENKSVFSVRDVLRDKSNEKHPYEYRKLLVSVKEENYYIKYDKAVYEQIIIGGKPYGAVMLFNNNKLERIVYGYPNAG